MDEESIALADSRRFFQCPCLLLTSHQPELTREFSDASRKNRSKDAESHTCHSQEQHGGCRGALCVYWGRVHDINPAIERGAHCLASHLPTSYEGSERAASNRTQSNEFDDLEEAVKINVHQSGKFTAVDRSQILGRAPSLSAPAGALLSMRDSGICLTRFLRAALPEPAQALALPANNNAGWRRWVFFWR